MARQDRRPLWQGLKLVCLQEVSTDHCPFNFKGQKELGRQTFTKIPSGGPGVEDTVLARGKVIIDAGRSVAARATGT